MSVDLRVSTGWDEEQNDDEWEEICSLFDECKHLYKEEERDEEAIKREQARCAYDLYRAVERELLERGELSNFDDQEDLPPYPDPDCCLVPPSPSPSPEMYIYRPVIMHTPPPPRPRPRPRPPLPSSFKSLSLEVEETLEKKTEINDDKAKGHKNNNRVVSKRKMKRGRNVDRNRK